MSLTVALAGDTMLGRNVGERLGRPGSRLLAPELQEIVDAADLFLANLECCISDRGEPVRESGKPFFFRAPPAAADCLAEIGVRCVTLANNHALDFGTEALMDTLDRLRAVGIAAAGAGCDEQRARAPAMLTADAARVRVVAVSDHPASYAAAPDRPGIAFADLAGAGVPSWLLDACACGEDADVMIVLAHWGPNMQMSPVPHVRRAAVALETAGASLIAGHSAHVPQGPSGRTLFDLGDFIDDYAVDRTLRNDLGVLWLVTLDRDGPRRVEGVPLRLALAHTRCAGPEDTRLLHSLLQRRCAAVGSSVRREGDRFVFESAPPRRWTRLCEWATMMRRR
jgi:poly-gamma-glutamate capsule biosynthesis protein CapA/YwtB (metallophosphatase superfamily)